MVNINTFNFNDSGQLLVTDVGGLGGVEGKHIYGTSSIAADSTVTVSTFSVITGKTLIVLQYGFGGEADGIADLEVASVVKDRLRNSAAKRSEDRTYGSGIVITGPAVVSVKVTNCGDNLKAFEAFMNGELYDTP